MFADTDTVSLLNLIGTVVLLIDIQRVGLAEYIVGRVTNVGVSRFRAEVTMLYAKWNGTGCRYFLSKGISFLIRAVIRIFMTIDTGNGMVCNNLPL